ncbi:MAG: hypothetical protein AAGG75_00055 [Bacteroidota bacterium]
MKQVALIGLLLFSFTGINLLTIGKGAFSPFHMMMTAMIAWFLLFSRKQSFYTFMSLNLLAIYILLVNVLYHGSFRFTSLLYSMIFIIELTIFYNLIRRCSPATMAKGFRMIIYLYFANIIIGTLLIKAGLRWPFMEQWIGIARTTAGTRPMGFSSEPSYAAFILSIAYLSYNHIIGHRLNRSTLRLSLVYLLCIGLMGSAYGFILLLLTLLDWVRHFFNRLHSSLKMVSVFVVLAFVAVVVRLAPSIESEATDRIYTVSSILGDPFSDTEKKLTKLKEKDPSAFARIGPTYTLFFSEESADLNVWLGAGAGAAGVQIPILMQGVLIDEGDTEFDTGIVPAFIYDYGLVGFVLLLLFVVNCANNLPFPFWLTFIFLLPNANINTQIFWFLIGSFLMVSIIKLSQKHQRRYSSNYQIVQL